MRERDVNRDREGKVREKEWREKGRGERWERRRRVEVWELFNYSVYRQQWPRFQQTVAVYSPREKLI